jgi:hypothetical protein
MPILPTGTRRVWIDSKGEPFTAPASARTGVGPDGRTHLLFAPFDPWKVHPLTLCGIRADQIPGADDANCRDCREAREVQ